MTTLTDEKNEEAPAPTLNSGADREAIAKLIDPASFNDIHIARVAAHRRQSAALEKADAILSLHRAVDGGAVEDALKPFAKIADLYDDREDDSFRIVGDMDLDAIKLLTLGACRKARTALPRVSTGGAAGEPVVVAAVTADGRLHVNDPPILLLARPTIENLQFISMHAHIRDTDTFSSLGTRMREIEAYADAVLQTIPGGMLPCEERARRADDAAALGAVGPDALAQQKREPGFVKPDNDRQVFFYEQDFYVLSNFSAFRLDWNGLIFDTSEAAYHYEKFAGSVYENIGREIRNAHSAHEAFKLAELHKDKRRPDWDAVKVNIMLHILRAKATQHEYVRRKLLASGNRELIEDSWRDDFWGWGPNRAGKNMLGNLWMQVRSEIRASSFPSTGRATLRTSEKMLLEWLQKGDGQYGECQGDTLNDLIERGLAVVQGVESGLSNGFIAKGTDIMYRAVSITDAGRAALAADGCAAPRQSKS